MIWVVLAPLGHQVKLGKLERQERRDLKGLLVTLDLQERKDYLARMYTYHANSRQCIHITGIPILQGLKGQKGMPGWKGDIGEKVGVVTIVKGSPSSKWYIHTIGRSRGTRATWPRWYSRVTCKSQHWGNFEILCSSMLFSHAGCTGVKGTKGITRR